MIYLLSQHYSETSYYTGVKLSIEWFWMNLATILQLIPLGIRAALGVLCPNLC